jgi:hypothetical protein
MADTEEIIEEETEETPDKTVEEKKEEVVEEKVEEEVIDVEKLEVETRKFDDTKVEYGEDIDAEDIKTIGTIVEKQTAGVKKQLQDTIDRQEVDSFIAEKPEYAKYKPVILKYLQHPVYSKIPVKNIAAIVASNDLMKIGAKKEREAQKKADDTKTNGGGARTNAGGSTDWLAAPKDDFEAKKREVLQRR